MTSMGVCCDADNPPEGSNDDIPAWDAGAPSAGTVTSMGVGCVVDGPPNMLSIDDAPCVGTNGGAHLKLPLHDLPPTRTAPALFEGGVFSCPRKCDCI